jgi:hypothetical protein
MGVMRTLAVLAVLAVAGCAGGGLFEYDVRVPGGGGGLPETRAVARADRVVPPGRRELGLGVRTFVADASGEPVEVSGATCRIRAGDLRAVLAAPGRLLIEDLGPDAPLIVADCSDGVMAGTGTAAPDFAWEQGGGNSFDRFVWGGGGWWGGYRTGPMLYPDINVVLSARP